MDDMDEAFARRAAVGSRVRARWWYRRQAVASVWFALTPRINPGPFVGALRDDLRYAWRRLRRAPGFTAVAVTSLALGIGVNTAAFSALDSLLLRPLPYPDAGRLTSLWTTDLADKSVRLPASYPDWQSWTEGQHVFRGIAAFRNRLVFLRVQDESRPVEHVETSVNLLDVLRIEPALGRGFVAADAEAGAPPVAIVSDATWRHQFSADRDALGKIVTIESVDFLVIGIMPPSFASPAIDAPAGLALTPRETVWTVFRPSPRQLFRGNRGLRVVARLETGRTLADAQAAMTTLGERLADHFPDSNRGRGIQVLSLHDVIVDPVRTQLLILTGVVAVVLLLACANVATLMLARSTARRHDAGVRAALGASPSRIARQFLTESLLLAMLGGAAGLGLAGWIVSLVRASAVPGVPRLDTLAIDWRVWTFSFALTLATGALFGLAPAIDTARVCLTDALKRSRTCGPGRAGLRIRRALVAIEIGLAFALVLAAALFLESFWRLQRAHGIPDPDRILTLQVVLPRPGPGTASPLGPRYQLLTERLRQLPGVKTVGVTSSFLQLGDASVSAVAEEGRPAPPGADPVMAAPIMVNADYFPLAGVRLRAGRLLTDRDDGDAAAAILINETLAARLFGGQSPIGRRLLVSSLSLTPRTVVGVVSDTPPYRLGVVNRPHIYYPYGQAPSQRPVVMIGTAGLAASIAPDVRRTLRGIDPALPISGVTTAAAVLDDATLTPRWSMLILLFFGLVALTLAATGVYGVVSHVVAQQTAEIGTRIALGARPERVRNAIVRQNLVLTLVGIVGGALVSLLAARHVSALLFGVTAIDPPTVLGAALVLLVVAGAASYRPAARAARIDPVRALRME